MLSALRGSVWVDIGSVALGGMRTFSLWMETHYVTHENSASSQQSTDAGQRQGRK